MAHTKPDAASFKKRYPEFEAVADSLVSQVIDEGTRFVDETWAEGDYGPALKAITAHMLAMEGEPGRSRSAQEGGGLPISLAIIGEATKAKVGDVEFTSGKRSTDTSGTPTSEAADGDRYWATTPYGQRFLNYRRNNYPRVAVS